MWGDAQMIGTAFEIAHPWVRKHPLKDDANKLEKKGNSARSE